jgi:membrane protease YdiL (CAAX protease family)
MLSEKRWQGMTVLYLAVLVMLSLIAGMLLAGIIAHIPNVRFTPTGLTLTKLVCAVAGFQGAAIVWVHFFLRKNGVTWGEGFGFDRRNYGQCIGLAFAFLPVAIGGQLLFGKLSESFLLWLHSVLHWEWLKPAKQQAVELLQMEWPLSLIILQGLVALVVAPVAEELLFRGVLYQAVKQRSHPVVALWLSAFLFGLIHFYPVGFVSLLFLAVLLVAIYEKTKNLLAPILLHSLFNTVNFVLIVTQPKWADELLKP